MMALEETEHILTSLNKLSVTDETNLSEQDLLIMEESAQVRVQEVSLGLPGSFDF